MQKKPSNTREQCAFDRGAQYARACLRTGGGGRAMNPHKKGSVERDFWNEGFDSV
jgi:hypothetical protein